MRRSWMALAGGEVLVECGVDARLRLPHGQALFDRWIHAGELRFPLFELGAEGFHERRSRADRSGPMTRGFSDYGHLADVRRRLVRRIGRSCRHFVGSRSELVTK